MGWIGVDLDRTLAYHDDTIPWGAPIGDPIPLMLDRVKDWLAAGIEVRIFTARLTHPKVSGDGGTAHLAIEAWCLKHLGYILPVTNAKDWECEGL